jgi:ubiquinone biosynthesis protein
MPGSYSPARVWAAFRFVHTVFVTFRKKERFLYLRPLSPVALKRTILDLGVSFIKLAQVLATRADFFTEEYLVELRAIHDEVEPMTAEDFAAAFKRAFNGAPPFASFEDEPLASASIGQVHAAELPDGTLAAVKIRRFGIVGKVLADIRILRLFLRVFRPFFTSFTKNSLEALIAEFSVMILKETDLALECDNLRKFTETYKDSGVIFPKFYPEYSSPDALVMSFEHGARVDDKAALARMDVSFAQVMDELVSFYAEQMLVKGFFHADPHPGNILVREDGRLVLLDFGMVKRLPASTRVAMIEMVKAAHEQDYEVFIASCKRLGVIAASAPEAEMRDLAERMFDIFGNDNLSAASMQALAFDVLHSMREFPFKFPQDVIYVMRASSLIEGLGTSYIENFNGVKDILPVLLKNMRRALGAEAELFPSIKEEIVSLPLTFRRIKTIINDLSDANLKVKLSSETLEIMGDAVRRFLRPIFEGGLWITAAFFLTFFDFPYRDGLSWALFIAGAIRIMMGLR